MNFGFVSLFRSSVLSDYLGLHQVTGKSNFFKKAVLKYRTQYAFKRLPGEKESGVRIQEDAVH